jgi:predicted membrane protein
LFFDNFNRNRNKNGFLPRHFLLIIKFYRFILVDNNSNFASRLNSFDMLLLLFVVWNCCRHFFWGYLDMFFTIDNSK